MTTLVTCAAAENLFSAILARRSPRTEPEPETETEDSEPETENKDIEMDPTFGQMMPENAPTTTPAKPTELKLNQPNPFTGKRDEVDDFLQDVSLYLDINEQIY